MKPDGRCPRRAQVRRLQRAGDGRWRRAARADLRDLAADEAGAELLARAIGAMLRRGAATAPRP